MLTAISASPLVPFSPVQPGPPAALDTAGSSLLPERVPRLDFRVARPPGFPPVSPACRAHQGQSSASKGLPRFNFQTELHIN